jgi:hypothetical protein
MSALLVIGRRQHRGLGGYRYRAASRSGDGQIANKVECQRREHRERDVHGGSGSSMALVGPHAQRWLLAESQQGCVRHPEVAAGTN